MNFEEGVLCLQLLDWFGLCIDVYGEFDLVVWVEIIWWCFDYDVDLVEFDYCWQSDQNCQVVVIERVWYIVVGV